VRYREVQVLKKAAAKSRKAIKRVAIVSDDEKPGIQAIATTAPDLPPKPGVHATFARDLRDQSVADCVRHCAVHRRRDTLGSIANAPAGFVQRS
jgi:hypothetical protein